MSVNRRTLLAGLTAAAAAPHVARGQEAARVIVVGGGFGGATCSRALRAAGVANVTLVEASPTYVSCPFSNAVIVGLREMEAQRFGYDRVRASGVAVVHAEATAIDVQARRVVFGDGTSLPFDRLVLAPGIDLRFDALPGYTEAAADAMPHAWKGGVQTELLRRQLDAMEDGGTVVMAVPPNPFRCPPGPYERASLIAHYLKTRKPRSKLIVLDAKDTFSKQRLFQDAWAKLYPDHLEWVPLSSGGRVTEVDAAGRVLRTEFGEHKAQVANVIPPQRGAMIAQRAGVADRSGWCPIDPATFEARLQPGIHVIGDAAVMGAIPKSAFAANAEAKACAAAVAGLLRGQAPPAPILLNTCYSLVAPDYGISVAGVDRPNAAGLFGDIEGAGGTSPLDAPPETRSLEARYAEDWFTTITTEVFA